MVWIFQPDDFIEGTTRVAVSLSIVSRLYNNFFPSRRVMVTTFSETCCDLRSYTIYGNVISSTAVIEMGVLRDCGVVTTVLRALNKKKTFYIQIHF